MDVCVTGHRPSKLSWGYDYNNSYWQKLKEVFKVRLVELKCDKAWSGMALGVDMVFALAVIELQEEGYDIKLCCAIPCRNQDCKWPKESKDLYNQILSKADVVKLVTDAPYSAWLMQKRNMYMVDHVDKVIAVWDGSEGGTANCVKYANKVGKSILRILPKDIEQIAS